MTELPAPISPQEQQLKSVLGLADPAPAFPPLLPHQSAFAEWLSSQPQRPPVSVQRKMYSKLCQRLVSPRTFADHMSKLKTNPHYIRYYASLQADALRRSRVILEEHYTEGVETHLDGMRMAREAEDYKAIPAFTVPILDRVVPKREAVQANTQINVVLSTKQKAVLDNEQVPDVSFEVLPPETLQQ